MIENQNNNINQINQQSKKNNTLIIILIIVFILVILAFMISVLLKKENTQTDNNLEQNQIINDETILNNIENKYKPGTEVVLVDDSKWYIVKKNDTSITLLSQTTYGELTYYSKRKNIYEQSLVKEIVETEFLPELKLSLENNGGNTTNLSARILSGEEILEIIGEKDKTELDETNISNDFKWLYIPGDYWLSSSKADENDYYLAYRVGNWVSLGTIEKDEAVYKGTKANIRPVIETSIDNIKG